MQQKVFYCTKVICRFDRLRVSHSKRQKAITISIGKVIGHLATYLII